MPRLAHRAAGSANLPLSAVQGSARAGHAEVIDATA